MSIKKINSNKIARFGRYNLFFQNGNVLATEDFYLKYIMPGLV